MYKECTHPMSLCNITMSLPTLPVELVDSIFKSVAAPDLVALSSTCSSLCPVAQRLLYRHISISALSHNINVVSTLAKRPDLAVFVRSFAINSAAMSPLFPAFYHLLATALSGMTEVTSLNILVDSSVSWMLEKAGQNITYHRLRQFTCAFPFDSNVAQFLDKAPALLELDVDSMPYEPSSSSIPIPSLSPTTIPHLVQFIGSARAARAIVPGRPLQNIQLNEGDLVEEDVACLAQSDANVLVLGAIASTPPVALLEAIARHLPHLAYLRIMTTYHFTHAPEIVSHFLFLSILSRVTRNNAHCLFFAGVHGSSRQCIIYTSRSDGFRAFRNALGFIKTGRRWEQARLAISAAEQQLRPLRRHRDRPGSFHTILIFHLFL